MSRLVLWIDAGCRSGMQPWRDPWLCSMSCTGVSWGNYQDYFYGRFRRRSATRRGQTDRNGNRSGRRACLLHVSRHDLRQIFVRWASCARWTPGLSHSLEEPEFLGSRRLFRRFKREVANYYGEALATAPQFRSMPNGQFQIKNIFLYRRSLQQVVHQCAGCTITARRKAGEVLCATHSSFSLRAMGIVRPEFQPSAG